MANNFGKCLFSRAFFFVVHPLHLQFWEMSGHGRSDAHVGIQRNRFVASNRLGDQHFDMLGEIFGHVHRWRTARNMLRFMLVFGCGRNWWRASPVLCSILVLRIVPRRHLADGWPRGLQ